MTLTLYDSRGQRVQTGKTLGRKGEGTVLEVCDSRNLVAKVYHSPDAERAAKLACMIALKSERLLKIAAWPEDTLHSQPGGAAIGFLMPRVAQPNEVHEFYSIKNRLAKHPQANWKFLLCVAANLSRAFRAIHDHNFVIGDVNEGNVFVSSQATVMLLDCDSFQVVTQGHRFLCGVGMENYTPPELQGVGFRNVERTADHDAFGLAVLIFLLLCLGRHPFSGRYLGSGDMPIGKAIAERRFAYGDQAKSNLMHPPPATPALAAVSPAVAALFERAFMNQGTGQKRPCPDEWVNALDALVKTLKPCAQHAGHVYWNGLSSCPWCPIEAAIGILVFPFITPQNTSTGSSFDVYSLWKQIAAIVFPAPLPAFPTQSQISLLPSSWALQQKESYNKGFGAVTAYFGVNAKRTAAKQQAQQTITQVQSAVRLLQQTWQSHRGDNSYHAKLRELEQCKTKYLGLPGVRQKKIQQLEANRRQSQLLKYLDGFTIWFADISGIGPGRKTTLQSYSIETAADVVEANILSVPGFGPTYTSKLLAWRQSLERRFVFNPALGIDASEIARVDADIATTRQKLEQQLQHGLGQLRLISQNTQSQRQLLIQRADQLLHELAQAQADLNIL